jgi:release factor glutamine methyltransferase
LTGLGKLYGVFKPTTTTQLLVKNMGNLEGKTVLDLGCGAGPVAISAALSGEKKVYAIDIMEQACEATRRNAKLNNVLDRVEVLHGNLFEP